MKAIEVNVGNASDAKVRVDLEELWSLNPAGIGAIEVHDRRSVLHQVAREQGAQLFQPAGAAEGHCALLVDPRRQPRNFRTHKLNDKTKVGRDVAGAADTGYSAEKHILAIDITLPRGRDVTMAVCHFVPSASHSAAASRLLELQANEAARWLRAQDLPTDLMVDLNGRIDRPEFARLRKEISIFVTAPSRGGAPIDGHLLTQGTGQATAHRTSSDHKAIEADIAWRRS